VDTSSILSVLDRVDILVDSWRLIDARVLGMVKNSSTKRTVMRRGRKGADFVMNEVT